MCVAAGEFGQVSGGGGRSVVVAGCVRASHDKMYEKLRAWGGDVGLPGGAELSESGELHL